MGFIASLNASVENSIVGRYFKFKERETTFTIELNGALSTFMSMGTYRV
jgi:xanthine/uracil/vitamin C permease (AzgA family)